MKQGLVSIITPMYNAEKYVGQTINSVLSQTYENWQALCAAKISHEFRWTNSHGER